MNNKFPEPQKAICNLGWFPSKPESERVYRTSEASGSVFNYVNVVGRGCEGWLNLFFGDEIIALVNNVALADEIRKTISERKPNGNGDNK